MSKLGAKLRLQWVLNTVYEFNFAQICKVFYLVYCLYNLLIYCYIQRKGVSPDTPSHIIQKHYEFYLANKIKSYRYIVIFVLAYSVDVSFHCATLKVRSLRSQ